MTAIPCSGPREQIVAELEHCVAVEIKPPPAITAPLSVNGELRNGTYANAVSSLDCRMIGIVPITIGCVVDVDQSQPVPDILEKMASGRVVGSGRLL